MNNKEIMASIRDFQIRRNCRKKIRKISRHLGVHSSGMIDAKSYKQQWGALQFRPTTAWAETFCFLTQNRSIDYIAEDIYYTRVEPVLNSRSMSKAETCKTNYYSFYPEFKFPSFLAANIDGVLYSVDDEVINPADLDVLLKESTSQLLTLIVKPTLDSGGGEGVRKFINENGKWIDQEKHVLNFDLLSKLYGHDYIIQYGLEQHVFFSQFNESSVNTLRILTYRSVTDESIHVLHTLLRVGKMGSITDNQASGGFAIGVHPDGYLRGYGVNKKGDKFTDINGISLSNPILIPRIEDFYQTATRMARKLKFSRLIGHDLTLDSNGDIIFIEVNNSSNEINFYQMNNGSLFGCFTSEIIDYCASHPRSFCFDFTL